MTSAVRSKNLKNLPLENSKRIECKYKPEFQFAMKGTPFLAKESK
jgi:hypothetical protein